MKNKTILIIFIFVFTIFTFQFCEKDRGVATSPPPESVTSVITTGENIFRSLIMALTNKLTNAIKESGFTGAIEICNLHALPLTDKIAQSNEKVFQIKRTSYQYRNKKNKPDKFENTALKYFESFIKNGESLPSFYVQKIEKASGNFYRYYKPLTVMPMCLNCHGNSDDMSEEVIELLERKYPNDKAAGYSLNDFRGIISISISE
ncbi:MAG: DUF3365 domain-containing protein [Fidelibacterota bacterium]